MLLPLFGVVVLTLTAWTVAVLVGRAREDERQQRAFVRHRLARLSAEAARKR